MMSDTTEGKQHHIHKNIYWRRTQSLCTSTHYHIFVAKNKHEATANEKKNKANKHRQLFVCAKHFHWTIFTVLLKPDKKHAKKKKRNNKTQFTIYPFCLSIHFSHSQTKSSQRFSFASFACLSMVSTWNFLFISKNVKNSI